MKLSFFRLAVLLILTIAFVGCNEAPTQPTDSPREEVTTGAAAFSVTTVSADQDTISTSSSTDEFTTSLMTVYSRNNYVFQVSADSISGGTTATCYLEVNPDLVGSDWAVLETVIVDGVSTRAYETGEILRGSLRCRCAAASSTQVTVIRSDLVVTDKPL